jgi:hypothetical protein
MQWVAFDHAIKAFRVERNAYHHILVTVSIRTRMDIELAKVSSPIAFHLGIIHECPSALCPDIAGPRQWARLGRWFCPSHPSTQALAYLPSVVLNRRRARDTQVIYRVRFRFPVKYKVHFNSNFLLPLSSPFTFVANTHDGLEEDS